MSNKKIALFEKKEIRKKTREELRGLIEKGVVQFVPPLSLSVATQGGEQNIYW